MNVPGSSSDLQQIYHERMQEKAALYALYTEIERATRGIRPSRYDPLFHEDEIPVEFRSIQLAAMDLTAQAKKVFNIEVSPTGTTKARVAADEKVEKIAYGWNEGAANIGLCDWKDEIMGEWARFQVLFSDACFMFLPHYETKTLFGQVKDPRLHFPPAGWHPYSIVPLDNTLIVSKVTLGELRKRYPDHVGALNHQYATNRYSPGSKTPSDSTPVTIGEFYGTDAWYVRTLEDKGVTLVQSEADDKGHPGVCPVVTSRLAGFDPLFAGQLGLEVALQKVLSQEIQATDEMLHGPVTGSPLVGGDLVADRYNILRTDIPGERVIPPQRLAPTSPLNTQRVIGELMSMLRIANRNPESFQGAGDANSAKAVQTLQAGIRSTVQDILWPPMMGALRRAYEKARVMEMNLWPLEPKTVVGKKGREYHEVSYRPGVDLADYKARIRVEHDGELGGYQGSLDRQQKMSSGLLSKRTAMEKDPDVRDVGAEWQQIELERLDGLIEQVIAAKGPELSIAGLIRVQSLVSEGKSKAEAFQQVEAEGGFAPPAPPPGAEPAGGLPPEIAAMMGQGAPEAPPMSLSEARGF